MIALQLAIIALALVLPDSVVAATNKTPLFTDGLAPHFNKDISNIPHPKTDSRHNGVPVPQACKDHAKDAKCDVSKVTARRVKYDDCEDPWVLCRCDDANMSMDTLELRWAKVPTGIRSYTGAILAVKASGCSGLNYGGQFIAFSGDCDDTVFLHEAGHSLDAGFSGEQRWTGAVNNSSCVPDDYSNASPAENWTQNNVIVTWAKQYGGWPKVLAKNSKAGCLKPQFDVINNDKRIRTAQNAKKCLRNKRPPLTNLDFDQQEVISCNFTTPRENGDE
ncbi:hypothetical protein BKA62DRAFT_723556 [Auriculariales sp. MPI-PUGE-AT-0066]|nr:hypothetical protein BKA62DRAFT_723556 [Auriculariales sp. MPI-PUGE-AT-0066]